MKTYAGGYVIEFDDGGEPDEQVLVTGTEEECERVLAFLPAVAYSGTRPVRRAYLVIAPVVVVAPVAP